MPSVERHARLEGEFRLAIRDALGRNVGSVEQKQIHRLGEGLQKIALDEPNTLRDPPTFRILKRERQGIGRDVRGKQGQTRALQRQCDRNDPGAHTHLRDKSTRFVREQLEGGAHEAFRVRSRDQRTRVAEEVTAHELRSSEKVLEGLSGRAACCQMVEGPHGGVRERHVRLEDESLAAKAGDGLE